MMPLLDWVWANAEKLRDLAAIVGVLGTIGGVGVAVWRSRVERRLQREVNAKRTYAGVLRMSFEHPGYAEPDTDLHTDPERKLRYIWFVSNALNALDEILVSTDDAIWRETASLLLHHHAAWLATDEFQTSELSTYSDALKPIVKKVVASYKSTTRRQSATLQSQPRLTEAPT